MTDKTRSRSHRNGHPSATAGQKGADKGMEAVSGPNGSLTPLKSDLIERFGDIYETYGLQRLKGLLVGLLLTHDEPLSLDDMVERLGRSKGPISTTVRELLPGGAHSPRGWAGEPARLLQGSRRRLLY